MERRTSAAALTSVVTSILIGAMLVMLAAVGAPPVLTALKAFLGGAR